MADQPTTTEKEDLKNTESVESQGSATQEEAAEAPIAAEAASEVHEAVEKLVPAEALEKGKDSDLGAAGGTQAQQTSTKKASAKKFVVPEKHEQLMKEIDHELSSQLKTLQKDAQKARGGIFRQMDADKLTRVMSEIRRVKQLLSEIIHMTTEALKALYRSLFQPRGL